MPIHRTLLTSLIVVHFQFVSLKKKPLSNMFIINIMSMPGASTELIHLFIKEIINLILGLIVGKKR